MCIFFFLLSPARFPFQREREIVSQVVHFPINAMLVVLVLLSMMMMMKMRRRRWTARGDGDRRASAGDDDDDDDEDDEDEGKLTWRQLATNSSLVSTPSWLVSNLVKEVSFPHDEAENVISLDLRPVESHLDSFPHLAGGHLHVRVATHPR